MPSRGGGGLLRLQGDGGQAGGGRGRQRRRGSSVPPQGGLLLFFLLRFRECVFDTLLLLDVIGVCESAAVVDEMVGKEGPWATGKVGVPIVVGRVSRTSN